MGEHAQRRGAVGVPRNGVFTDRARRSEDDSPFTRTSRAVALVVAFAVAVFGLSLAPIASPAEAVVVQWGTNSGSAPNYQANVNGDFLQVGNGVLACSTALGTGNGSCAELHSTSTNANNANDNFAMVNSNTVGGFSTNSSSATLTIPAGASVARAFLSWSANTGSYAGDNRALCTAFTTARGTATLPAGSATGYRTQPVQLRVGGGALTSIAPANVLEDPTAQAAARYYSATADVTAAFAGAATGSALTVSAGNIWAPTGAGCYAGWSLTVVYDFGSYIVGNTASVPHRIIWYQGHVRQGTNDADLQVGFSGFQAVDVGTRAGFTLYEGDRSISGDTAEYSRAGSTTYTEIPNAAGATGNFGIGRATGSVRYTSSGTPFTNQSVDVTQAPLTNVVAGDSSVSLRIGTTGDSYLLTNAVLSVPVAGLQVNKTLDGTTDVQYRTAAEPATFTVVITNTGAGTLRNFVVADDQNDCARTLTGVSLAPQQSYTYTCRANTGSGATYVSTANVTATTLVGNYLASDSDSTDIVLSAIGLTKTSALAPGATGRAGDVLTYTFTATNTGGAPLTGVAISDPLPRLSTLAYAWPGAAGALAPGQAVTATGTYTLTQADVDAGSIANTATTSGVDPDGGPTPTATTSRTTPIAAASTLAVSKAGSLPAGATGVVGDRVSYRFSFTNTGNVTLTGVALADPLPGLSTPAITWPGTAGTLAPGQTATATASYVIRQSDVDAGAVRNTATVTGRTPQGQTTTGSSPQSVVPTIAQAPALVTTKSAARAGAGAVGDVVTYTFTARNSGNVTLTGVAITDPLPGLSAVTYGAWPSGTAGTLAPGQQVTATATYTITQVDVNAGAVRNTATTAATSPTGAAITAASPQVTVATVASAPALALTKTGALAPGATGVAGDTVTYTFTLRNSGNVTLTGATIADPLPGLSALAYGTWPSGTAGTLQPGQQVTATATYSLRQSDVDAGAVANSATATATPPNGANVTQTRAATVPITPTGALVVTKTGALTSGTGGVGSTVGFTITFRNSGNVTLGQLALTDSLAGLSAPVVTWPGTAGTLAPGQTATATASYTVRQADVDAGSVRNTASVTGRTPAGATVTGASSEAVVPTVTAAPALALTKTGVVAGGAAGNAGDRIDYTFVVRNSGNVTLTGVAVADQLPGLSAVTYGGWPGGTAGTLTPGQQVTAVASYTIRQADVNAGGVRNTATASAAFGASPVSAAPSTVLTPTAAASPAIVTTKSGTLASGATGRAGDSVVWTITLRNTGNVTLTGVTVADSLPGISAPAYGTWPSGTAGTLQPGQTVTATATSTLSQQDVNAGAVSNAATGSGTPPTGPATSSTASATVPLASAPALALAKSGAVTSGGGGVGSTITYSFSLRNSGNVTLTQVSIADPLAGLSALEYTWPGTAGTLAPNQTVTATATRSITQADVDAGSVRNTATATGRTPTGTTTSATSAAVTVPTVAAAPAIVTTKTAAVTGSGVVGDTVVYTFTARNSGNVTLTAVGIADPLAGLTALAYSWPDTPGVLAPGQTVTATAGYTLTQADVNRGSVTNRATASGTPPTGTPVSSASAQIVTPTAPAAPAIAVTKTGALPPGSTNVAGDRIDYTFTVRNTGNVTLTGVTLTDVLPGLSALAFGAWPGEPGVLQPRESITATASYTLRQADVDAGSVANTATATGAPPTGAGVTATAPATVPVTSAPAIAVTKSAALAAGATGAVGDRIEFSFTLRNPGNVTLTGVTLTDSLPGISVPAITWPGAAGVLQPGQTATATAGYTITQADVNTGSVRNTATTIGRTPQGATVTADSNTVTVPTVTPANSLAVTKQATVSGTGAAGDAVTYRFTVANAGNQTLTGVVFADPLPGLSPLEVTWPGPAGTLQPGQAATAVATYTITQADVDRGSIANRATASGTTPGGDTVTAASATVTTPTVAAASSLAVTKRGATSSSRGTVGDTVTWTITLRNTGNLTLSGVGAADSLPGISPLSYGTWPSGTAGVLRPGDLVTATATSTVSQADVDAGSIANTATGSATDARGVALTATAPATVPLAAIPGLTLGKTATVTGNAAVGDTIAYTFVLRNTGTVTLTGAAVTDTLPGLSALTYTWPGPDGRLLPNQTATATATRQITQTDVNTGSVRNTATATAAPPTGPAVTATSPTVTVATIAAGPALETVKTAVRAGSGGVGDTIAYTIEARNSGNVTLTGVGVTDTLPGLPPLQYTWPGTPGVLDPGQTVTATATYVLTQTDVNRGSVANVATASGAAPNGAPIADDSPAVVTPTAATQPTLAFSKTGALAGGATGEAGDTVAFSFSVRNSGNVTLTSVGIVDPLPGISGITFGAWPSGTPGTVEPGQTVTASATYTLTQADVDAGAVTNTAVASGTPPTGAATTTPASATVPVAADAALTLEKSGRFATASTGVGSGVVYTFRAENTGNVTLTGVAIVDPLPGLGAIEYSWPGRAGVLAPGESVVALATYTVRQIDVDRGSIANTAAVSGRPPVGGPATASSPTVTLTPQAASPAVETTKSAATTGTGVGDTVTYTLTARNTGNTTLTGVTIADPLPGLSAVRYGTWPSGTAGVLLPGQVVSATATYSIRQADVNAGTVRNTATTSATAPSGAPVSDPSGEVVTPTQAAAPALQFTQTGALASGSTGRAGESVIWSFTLRNTGNVTLTGATIAPQLAGISPITYGSWPSGTAGLLEPGQQVTGTATSTLTQADVDNGSVTDPATASGTPPTGPAVTATAPATVTITPRAAATIEKSGRLADPDEGDIGDTVVYSFVIRNTGTVTLSGVTFSDRLAGVGDPTFVWPGAAGVLAPGQTATATSTYSITEQDIDAGVIENVADLTAVAPNGAPVLASSETARVVPGEQNPAIEATKSSTGGGGAVGSTITYTFTATNIGNTTLDGVTLTDPIPGLGPVSYTWPGAPGVLNVGQTVTATAQYAVRQSDVNLGSVTNTVTASGVGPGPGLVVVRDTASTVTPTVPPSPALSVGKTPTLVGPPAAGSDIEYSFVVRNVGNTTLTAVELADELPGLGDIAFGAWPGPVGTLEPSQQVTATATYEVTQADVDAGSVANLVTATGRTPGDGTTVATDAATVTLAPSSALTLDKAAAIRAPGTGAVGDLVDYTFLVTNQGNVTLSGVTVIDELDGLSPLVVGAWPSGTAGVLRPGEAVAATATYRLTQSDIDRGFKDNVASVSAVSPDGGTVTVPHGVRLFTQEPAPALTTVKTSDGGGGGVGDVIDYTIEVENTGNTTVTGVAVADPLPGLSPLVYGSWPAEPGVLLPGESVLATATYTLTQADVDRGFVRNQATASGTALAGPVVDPSDVLDTPTVAQDESLAVTDAGALFPGATGRAGEAVRWSYTVTNDGNVTLDGVDIAEALGGASAVSITWPGTPGVLLPGQTATATSIYVLTQADVDTGSVQSTVTATGNSPTDVEVEESATATVTITPAGRLDAVKTGRLLAPGIGRVGDTIQYRLEIRNTGNVTLTQGRLLDRLPGLQTPVITWPDPAQPGRVGVGETVVGVAEYQLTQADVDRGFIENTAGVAAVTPQGATVTDDSNTVRIATVQASPVLATVKTAEVEGEGALGDTITYSITARNSGNVTLTGVGLADPLPGLGLLDFEWPGAVGVLAPGQSVTATADYTITQADLDRGFVANTATSTGTPPNGAAPVSGVSPELVTEVQEATPAVVVTDSGAFAPGSTARVGDRVVWTYTILNDGNVTLGAAALADALPGVGAPVYVWPGEPGVLLPGDTVSATAEYILTQADIDAGSVVSVVTGTGTAPDGTVVTDDAAASVTLVPGPDLTIVLSGAPRTDASVGDTIDYEVRLENTGNVTLSALVLAQQLAGATGFDWPGDGRSLAPGDVVIVRTTYVITQADVDAGSVTNQATVTGRVPSDGPISRTSNAVVTPTIAADPRVDTTKSATVAGTGLAGDIVTYDFSVRNAGNVTLTGVALTDALAGLSDPLYNWPAEPGVLAPGETVTARATYRVTQADVNAGSIVNTARGVGSPPVGAAAFDDATVTTTLATADPAIAVVDTGALAPGATGRAGDRVDWAYRLTNTGNVTLTGVSVTDRLPGATLPVFAWPDAPGVLQPGQSVTVTASSTLTQADVDAGSITSIADAIGTPPTGAPVTATDSATVLVAAVGALTAVKSGVIVAPGIGAAGDLIRYRLEITNTGNVTLVNGRLLDPLPGLEPPVITWPDADRPGRVGVGETVVGVADYRLTQADVDRGYIDNTADVAADDPNGRPVTATSNTVRIATVQATPALTTTKSGATRAGGALGDTIDWTIVIRNSGNVTVDGIVLTDELPGLSTPAIAWPGVTGVLAPGQTATATASSVIDQQDLDAGAVSNIASASGSSVRDDAAVESTDAPATVPTAIAAPSIRLSTSGQLAAGDTGVADDIVEWTYVVENTGTVTLTGTQVADSLAGVSAPVYVWPGAVGVLAPGQSVTVTASSRLTQADVDRGVISSAAVATGTPPFGADVTASDGADVTLRQDPAMAVTKDGTITGAGGVGDDIEYDFSITNTGTVTLTLVDLIDALGGVSDPVISWPGPPGVLAPGEVATATATYEITQADVDRGSVSNTAVATGKPPIGDTIRVSSPENVTTVQPAVPGLTVVKTATGDGGGVGDLISYSFEVVNSGNVTLTGVALGDPLRGLTAPSLRWPGEAGVLAPGQRATATATYEITQADVDAGEVRNTARATAVFGATPVSGVSDEVVTPTEAADAAVTVTDAGALAPGSTGIAGDAVQWTYVLTNEGNVTLAGASIADALAGVSAPVYSWPGEPGVLLPGQSVTATATSTLTQAQVDAGTVTSSITGSALDPAGDDVDATATAAVTIAANGVLVALKTGVLLAPGIGQVGDTVQYRLEISNRGNVTLTQGSLVDPLEGLDPPQITWPDPSRPGRVGVGETVVGVATYQLRQADIDRGYIENTAQVSARTPQGALVEADSNTVRVATVQPAPALETIKTAVVTGTGGVDDEVRYSFTTRNTGNVTLSGVTIADPLPGLAPLAYGDWPGAVGVLAPGEQVTATADYPIDQSDVDAGRVLNTATSSGTTPAGAAVSDSSPEVVTPLQAATPSVTVTDRGALAPGATGIAGDTVVFTYELTNTGNVTLTQASFADALPGAGAPQYVWPGEPGVLLPGQSVTATAAYVLTQADVDAGAVVSTVTGAGAPPIGAPATATASATVTVSAAPALSLVKTGALATAGANGRGDVIRYTFELRNRGNVTLSDVVLTDALAGITAPRFDWPTDTAGVIPPGGVATATAEYTIAQEDVDRGTVDNTATASAAPPTGVRVTAQSALVSIPTVEHRPGIATVKSAEIAGTGAVGETITYSFEITNTGNVTLRLISLRDELPGISRPDIDFPSTTGILAPGASAIGTATYVVTQADVDRGSVINRATSIGTSPRGVVVSGVSNEVTTATAVAAPVITTTHSAALAAGATGVVGDTIEYSFEVRNTGNVTLGGVSLANTVDGLTPPAFTWPGAPGVLLPGQVATATATRTVTQVDVDAGAVRNVSTATGTPPTGPAVSDRSGQTTVPLAAPATSLAVTKQGTLTGAGGVGDLVTYRFTVANTGTATLTGVGLNDPLPGLGAIEYGAWPTATAGALPPATAVEATAGYRITQADLDRGSVLNVATASGATLSGTEVTASSPPSVVPTVAADPRIQVEKRMRLAEGATGRAGDVVEYSFRVRNTGNVTLSGVTLLDAQSGLSAIEYTWPAGAGVLAPGAEATAIARYVLTQADVDRGTLGSEVTATADSPLGVEVLDEADDAIAIAADPALSLTKSSRLETYAQQGGVIVYTFAATNTGNVTLDDVTLTDPLPWLSAPVLTWPGEPGRLLPGQTLRAEARYVIDDADVTAGAVSNTATVSGTGPDGQPATASGSASVRILDAASIALDMSVALRPGQLGFAGDTLEYTYVVTNTGTRPLIDVRVADGRAGLSPITYAWPGEPGVLLPGQSVVATATYVITPLDEGRVLPGAAEAIATDADAGTAVTAADTADITLPARPIPGAPAAPPVSGGLARTGGDVGALGYAAALLLLSGLALALGARTARRKDLA
ncbi:putative repeat protein (TIGR01451 family) [Diaminobutyricimonas aerilata]|uniref:Putative repeat protein (TIGR01451 family) n=1 Tax=Diaminobutyricimonas aerilata TaxID=1162967 RepID=A0A2M9CNP5_9MICO|nr:DUF11 domain-containing protein [Diaminobutyricimonas aerilata]PJJ73531.1 putative repeat protein (TIGR01451 family) [Diaminobutyricimonas aerilata]